MNNKTQTRRDFEQASQLGFMGGTIYRWHVYDSTGKRYSTWAETEQAALVKRPGMVRVEPAPHLLDE